MSNEYTKEKRSRRLHSEEVKMKRQVKILKTLAPGLYPTEEEKQPHRLAKKHAMNCGNPNCVMCGNPRKFWKEKTIQEKRGEQMKVQEE